MNIDPDLYNVPPRSGRETERGGSHARGGGPRHGDCQQG